MARVNPRQFLAGLTTGIDDPVVLLNVDPSTVTTNTDLVFGVGDPLREVIYVECQASASERLHRDVLARNALLHPFRGGAGSAVEHWRWPGVA